MFYGLSSKFYESCQAFQWKANIPIVYLFKTIQAFGCLQNKINILERKIEIERGGERAESEGGSCIDLAPRKKKKKNTKKKTKKRRRRRQIKVEEEDKEKVKKDEEETKKKKNYERKEEEEENAYL